MVTWQVKGLEHEKQALKANVTALGYGLAALKALRPVEFRWNEQAPARADRSKQLGFIAQEAEAVAPELVKTDARGYKSMLCAPKSAPRGADRPRVSERRENARARGASPRALAGTTASASSYRNALRARTSGFR